MTNAYVTELIWHFAGYLQIFGTADADRADLAGAAEDPRSPGFGPGDADWIAPAVLDEAGAGAAMRFNLRQAGPAPIPKTPLAESGPDGAPGASPVFAPSLFEAPDFAAFAKFVASGFAAGAATAAPATPYALTWGEGGDGRLVDILQSNRLHDADLVLSRDDALVDGVAPRLAEMAREAAEALPEWLDALPEQGYEWADFLANRAQEVFPDAPFLAPGTYRDGAAIAAEDAPRIEIALPAAEFPDRPASDATGSAVVAGDNLQVNQALIVDAMTATRTLAVMGDVHLRDAIVQVIVHAGGDGEAAGASATEASGDALFANVARFSSEPYGTALPGWIPKSGLSVKVDVANTDILDVRMVAQRNLADDSDVVAWEGADAWTQMALGGNVQINDARLFDVGAGYDVIIVLGDYHALNLIVQVGVLDDRDRAEVSPDGGGSAGGGGGVVFNSAAIDGRGVDGWTAAPTGFEALAAALARGEDPGLEAFAGLSGAATGRLDVLVVTGDWYDVNFVWQINMLADADTVLLSGEEGASAATGGDTLVNVATIMDFGAIGAQYVGGDVYHDLMLFQANIAYEDPAAVVHGDPDALASEFIAFLEPDSIQTEDGAASSATLAVAHEDALGGVMA